MPNQEAGQILATVTAAATASENCQMKLKSATATANGCRRQHPSPFGPPPHFPNARGGQTDIIAAFNSGTGFNYTWGPISLALALWFGKVSSCSAAFPPPRRN